MKQKGCKIERKHRFSNHFILHRKRHSVFCRLIEHQMADKQPFISAQVNLPELTVKAILLGFILSAVLAAANAYLGLLLGMTVSASIPAAVISMAVLRFFRNHTILENNMVQTAASSGESLAAGVIFTLPALVLMHYWSSFNYVETTVIALAGGVLGVLFTIPLRRALIVNQNLKFPEGIATAEVLKAGTTGGGLIRYLAGGSLLGGLVKFIAEGLKLWGAHFEAGLLFKNKVFLYFGTYLTPAVMAVGYIVGLNISTLVFLGGAISWYLAIPSYIAWHGAPDGLSATELGIQLWSTRIRYLGVGAMIVGGLWAIISIRNQLAEALKLSLSRTGKAVAAPLRTEYDAPMAWVLLGIGVLVVPIFIIYLREVQQVTLSAVMTVIMMVAGFLFSAVAGYMAGLVGSSNNPISGVTIATVLTSALILVALAGTDSPVGAASAVMIGSVVCCAAAISGDVMQDLKAGHLLGATPYRQQLVEFIGVIAGALVMAPVLNLLNDAYTIGSEKLSAPQASLMRSVAEGVFGGNLPWTIIAIGAGIGVALIIGDQMLARRNASFRLPVLAVAVGMYLPLYLDTAIFIGGLIAYLTGRFLQNKADTANHQQAKSAAENAGLLFASGLITGEAVLGILLAIPIAATGDSEILRFFKLTLPDMAGLLALALCCFLLYRAVITGYRSYKSPVG
ncbi:MAG: oligopeptide transporter, OPT family [Chitinophagales bacterium]|nr:MAG: oligopeptide transporter, OPT family [Chitinophagales bacterium]